jgi:hypothetical protein
MIGLHPDYVWLPPGDGRIRARLAAAGYEVPVTTGHSFVAARAGAPPLSAVRAPAGACFP